MINKTLLSVREIVERLKTTECRGTVVNTDALQELRDLLDKPDALHQDEPVAVNTTALLGLLLSKITIDSKGFYTLSGIHPGNFKQALEASGAELTQDISEYRVKGD